MNYGKCSIVVCKKKSPTRVKTLASLMPLCEKHAKHWRDMSRRFWRSVREDDKTMPILPEGKL